jgi:hypothetical protein
MIRIHKYGGSREITRAGRQRSCATIGCAIEITVVGIVVVDNAIGYIAKISSA